jgi:6-phosphogluconolactonase
MAALLLLVCLGLLVACGGNNNSASNGSNSGNSPTPGSSNTGGNGNTGGGSGSGGFVYVGNSNGGISAFSINASDGNLSSVQGSPFSSGQVIDVAVADNTLASTESSGSLISWKIDPSTGALTKGSANSVSGVGFLAAAGDTIYASGSNAGIYTFTASNGNLSQVGSVASVASLCQDCQPRQLQANGQYVYVMLSGFYDVYGFAALPRGSNGALGTAKEFGIINNSTFPALAEAVSPNNRFVYESWETLDKVNVYQIDPAAGSATVVKQEAVSTGDEGQDAVVTRDGKFLLVLNNVSNNISVFSIDNATGLLTPVSGSPFPTGSRPVRMRFDSTGKYLYVICNEQGTKDIYGYRMDASTGALTQVAHQNIGGDPRAIAVK